MAVVIAPDQHEIYSMLIAPVGKLLNQIIGDRMVDKVSKKEQGLCLGFVQGATQPC